MLKRNENVTIALLSVTALVLGLMLWTTIGSEAEAAMPAATSGTYQMASGAISESTAALYVTDAVKQRMLVYLLDADNNTFRIIDAVDLSNAFRK